MSNNYPNGVPSTKLLVRKSILAIMDHIHDNADTMIDQMMDLEKDSKLAAAAAEILAGQNNPKYTSGDLHLQTALASALYDMSFGVNMIMFVILNVESSFSQMRTDMKKIVADAEEEAARNGVKIGV